jgi:hypothetical protein
MTSPTFDRKEKIRKGIIVMGIVHMRPGENPAGTWTKRDSGCTSLAGDDRLSCRQTVCIGESWHNHVTTGAQTPIIEKRSNDLGPDGELRRMIFGGQQRLICTWLACRSNASSTYLGTIHLK